jgi:hypothetical protein
MLCLASDCELNIRVWSLQARPHGLAWAGLVLKYFWVESWDFYFCTKRSTLLGGVSAPRPLQRPLRSSGRSLFFLCIFHSWGLINPHLGAASCLNFQSEVCLQGHIVKPDHVLCWMFFSWVWGCCVLHQSMSSIFESVACLQGHMVWPELGLDWNFFEWRVEIFIFAPKGPHY